MTIQSKVTVLIALTCLVLGAPRLMAATDYSKEGPYPVGVTTTTFVDESRTDQFTKKPRTLITEIWYPAADR